MTLDASSIPGRLCLSLTESRPTALTELRGIGPKTARRLQERGIEDQLDLLLFVPRAYRPTYRFVAGPQIAADRAEWVEAFGTVISVTPKRGRRPFELLLDVDDQRFKCLWFHLPYRGFDRSFKSGATVHFEGQVDHEKSVPTLAHPTAKPLKTPPPSPPPQTELLPVYSSMEKVHDSTLADGIASALSTLGPDLEEGLPGTLLKEHGLPPIHQALRIIHAQVDTDDIDRFEEALDTARSRLIFQEFFDLQQALTRQYIAERRAANAPICEERELGRALVRNLPFTLTGDQRDAIATIAEELGRRVPMRRLLQGDVGSGKTIVALMAAAIATGSGSQVAMMAPTEILARQHRRKVQTFFAELDLDTAFLWGSQSASERRDAADAIHSGRADLVVGTHALFQKDTAFDNLGLIIVDEEHKFGVEQRQALMALGNDPHLLSMTATPIPRSLAHAVFGDRDLTLIREKPPGRKPVRTVLRDRHRAPRVFQYLGERIADSGEQAYIVYPLVEASDAVNHRQNVIDGAQELKNGPLAHLKVGVLHGRMPGEAKDEVMQRFANGHIDVLCSTTVIEVGVDVPNATLMVIENAELFGLSQLHQLRGRVGRGEAASMCVLLAGLGLTDDARQRLHAMVNTDDGFDLAEIDLQIRGPGEFLGMKQAGLPEFRFGDILRDAQWMLKARRDARRLALGDASR